MGLVLAVGDLTIHRIIEQETTFLPALDCCPPWRLMFSRRTGSGCGRQARSMRMTF